MTFQCTDRCSRVYRSMSGGTAATWVPVQAMASVSCSGVAEAVDAPSGAEARAAVDVIVAATKAPRCFLALGARTAEEDRGTKTSSGKAVGRGTMYSRPI